MDIRIDSHVSQAAAVRIRRVVSDALGTRAQANVCVYVSRARPGRWSVFITGLHEHPLALTESIETALAGDDQ
jgi:hypothetical protein